jgi:ABC-type amino acid transport substrate-binding protein
MMALPRVLIVLALALLAGSSGRSQYAVESTKPTLVIAAEDGAGPWGQADGSGCGNDIVLAAYAAVKINAKLEVMPYARAKNGVLTGRYVACFGMAWTEDLKDKVVFADKPLYSVSAMLVQNLSKPLGVSEGKDLPQGTRVGTVFEYEYPSSFYDLVKRGILVPMPAYGEVMSLRNLDLNRVDAALVVVDELKSLDYLIAQAGLEGKVGPAFSLGGQGTYLGFSVAHPYSDYARKKFNEGFALIARDGTVKRILETWKNSRP